jgi:hypothetical protein
MTKIQAKALKKILVNERMRQAIELAPDDATVTLLGYGISITNSRGSYVIPEENE